MIPDKKINVAILEDHNLVADLLKRQLMSLTFISTVRIYNSPILFLEEFNAKKIDLLFLDLLMREKNGAGVIEAVRAHQSEEEMKIIVFSSVMDTITVKKMIRTGANAYLSKNAEIGEIEEAIQVVMSSDKVFISQSLKEAMVQAEFKSEHDLVLSKKEQVILELFCSGKTKQEIADALFLSIHTIHAYTKSLYKKLDVHSLPDLIVKAMRTGLCRPE